jgi:diguanylate cyclase (GGDEF)-like protein/PAS domain S-box-containing protein
MKQEDSAGAAIYEFPPDRPRRADDPDGHYLERELYGLLGENDDVFDFLQHGSLDGIWYWDLEKPENEWMSPAFWQTLGFDPAERQHLAAEWQDLIFPEDLQVALENFHAHCADPSHPYDQIVRYRGRDGGTVWVRCRGVAIRDAEGRPRRMLGAHNDVTELKRAELELQQANDRLEAMLRIDPLTGIANRRVFSEQLPMHAAISERAQGGLALLLVDVDHFKALNDRYGHPAGDAVLRALANELAGDLREGDVCCRLGGEEFAIIAHGMHTQAAVELAERLRARVAARERPTGLLTVSIGGALLGQRDPTDHRHYAGETLAQALYENADRLLYRAKENGRNRCEIGTLDHAAMPA